ncbi:unnamed protein product [Callosobruchus maculatus]|uniref:EF-hand domain-containing protein n=1 Tax=Callosobruchus maculatus TaxID=64391 RepID=A0A653CFZ3_CALMS|nr:unnamed protein product [Callosobruchus maculatus]
MFSQAQVAEFKDAFNLMDHDKDGILTKDDLRRTFDDVGKLGSEKELDDMVRECSQPISFTQFLGMFGTRMADTGGQDEDDVIVAAFKAFDDEGYIDAETFRHALMTWGERLTEKEVNDAFDAVDIDDDGKIETSEFISLLTAQKEEEES